jgi:hypothetical protein
MRKHYRDELDTGHIKATAKVAEILFRKATTDGSQAVTAAIFWLKTRGGWRETPQDHRVGIVDLTQLSDAEHDRGASGCTKFGKSRVLRRDGDEPAGAVQENRPDEGWPGPRINNVRADQTDQSLALQIFKDLVEMLPPRFGGIRA